MLDITLTTAKISEASAITDLINRAYRGESSRQGWTTEADLLDGCRTMIKDIAKLLPHKDKRLLVAHSKDQILGVVLVSQQNQQVELSLFAVEPMYQGRGIGKQLLNYAEQTAQQCWTVYHAILSVIATRQELITFYQRRGYRLTGETKPFPLNPLLWTPKVADLTLVVMAKDLAKLETLSLLDQV